MPLGAPSESAGSVVRCAPLGALRMVRWLCHHPARPPVPAWPIGRRHTRAECAERRSYVCQAAGARSTRGIVAGWVAGLDAAVEPAGDDSLERAADVAVGLSAGAALGLVVAGLGVASQPRDRDGVQGAVEVAVPATVEPVPDGIA